MGDYNLHKINTSVKGQVTITGSKSESNRLLILQQFYPEITIDNLSNSDDTRYLQRALNGNSSHVNIGPAGTAMRFLTAFYALKENAEVVLTGSERMLQRPVKVLVDALRTLGADIEYCGEKGYPPLLIKGKKLKNNRVEVQGNISSQYITALLLIAPKLKNGLDIHFTSDVTSIPYIKMTLHMLSELGVENKWEGDTISIQPCVSVKKTKFTVESDWSSASYFYSLAALSPGAKIALNHYRKNSLQGDAVLMHIYKYLGVSTNFKDKGIELVNTGKINPEKLVNLDLSGAPDIAQTITVTCFGLGIPCYLTGLHTLKIKETDRLVALKNEIEKLGGQVKITENSLELFPSNTIYENIAIATYEDHRMAMSFAPLSLRVPITILEPDVVSKSYPAFWTDLNKITGNQ